MKRFWTYILSGAVMLGVAAPAMAKEHGRDRDHHSAREWHEREHRDPYRRTRWNDHDRNDRRPGWDKGRKTGWRGGSLPPGHAKKHREYERERWAREHRHHHRRSTYTRGPIVTPRTNYPTRTYPNGMYPTRTYPTSTQTQHGRGPIPVPNVGQQTTTAQKPSGQGGPIQVPR